MKKNEFFDKLDNYIAQNYLVESTYELGEEYDIEEVSPSFIRVTLPLSSSHAQNWRGIIRKRLRGSIEDWVSISELGYWDSLELLYTHFKYWITYNSNCCLTDFSWNIIAYQDNNLWKIDFIESNVITRGFIVVNSGDKIEPYKVKKKYKKDQINLFLKEVLWKH